MLAEKGQRCMCDILCGLRGAMEPMTHKTTPGGITALSTGLALAPSAQLLVAASSCCHSATPTSGHSLASSCCHSATRPH
jgi:hypothetical protein